MFGDYLFYLGDPIIIECKFFTLKLWIIDLSLQTVYSCCYYGREEFIIIAHCQISRQIRSRNNNVCIMQLCVWYNTTKIIEIIKTIIKLKPLGIVNVSIKKWNVTNVDISNTNLENMVFWSHSYNFLIDTKVNRYNTVIVG